MQEQKDISNPLISIRDLHKSFGKNHVLRGFNLKLFDGENLVIVGKSGSGKSVCLKCIIGLEEIDSGSLNVLGKDIPNLNRKELDQVRTEVGFLFQGSALYDSMTVRENLLFPLRRHQERMQDFSEEELLHSALEDVGLTHTIDLMPEELSGGMKRRIALARTLILKPRIILYDEPTSGLDPITSREITDLILKVQNRYKTSSLIITHDMECAQVMANRMVILIDGVDHATGTYGDLTEIKDEKVRAFFK